jgi:hypothetical protein
MLGAARNDAVSAHEQCRIHDNLRAGHQERVGIFQIEQAEVEIAVIPAQILEAGDGAFLGERLGGFAVEPYADLG